MSSIGDSSQISDLSGISRISRSSGIRQAKADSAFGISECQASSTFREPAARSTLICQTASSITKLSGALKLMARCDEAMNNRARLKLLYDCLNELALTEADTASSNNVSTRLKNVLATHEVKKYLKLPNVDKKKNTHDLSLLGIVDLPNERFVNGEKGDLNATLETIFARKMNNFIESYEKSGGNITELLKSQESLGKTSLLDNREIDLLRWNDPTNEISTEYYRDMMKLVEMLQQWQIFKYTDMRELSKRNAENLSLNAQIAEIQAKISRKTCEWRMFNETNFSTRAFRILSESLDTLISEEREKIRRKEILTLNYDDISCTDYKELLKKYTEICCVIRKKERLMEML